MAKKKRKLTPEENIAINSQIPSRSKTVIFARAHKHDFGDASPCSRASWPVLVISDVLVSEIITFPFSISWIFYTFVANFTYSTQGVAKVYPRCSQGQKADITLDKTKVLPR